MFRWIMAIGMALFAAQFIGMHGKHTEKQLAREQNLPAMERFERSYLSSVMPKSMFVRLVDIAPGAAEFAVGLDPKTSKLAYLRWGILILIGWIHFSFLSPVSRRFADRGLSKTQVFMFPMTIIAFTLCFTPMLFLVAPFLPFVERLFDTVLKFVVMPAILAVCVTGLLSIPVTAGCAIFRLTHTFFRSARSIIGGLRGWQSSTRPAPSPWWLNQSLAAPSTTVSPAALGTAEIPGPVVRRRQINGVWYDE